MTAMRMGRNLPLSLSMLGPTRGPPLVVPCPWAASICTTTSSRSSPPYVPADEFLQLPREARLYEPAFTVHDGVDGLAIVRRAAAEEAQWLASGGLLLTEVSEPPRVGER